MEFDKKIFGKNLRKYRNLKGLTAEKLGEMVLVEKSTISKNELKLLKKKLDNAIIKVDSPKVIISILENIVNNWEGIDNMRKKKIIAAFLPRISVSKGGILYVTMNLPVSMP